MSDEATDLLVDILGAAEVDARKLWMELEHVAREHPERAEMIHRVLLSALERLPRQWQAGEIEHPDRSRVLDADVLEATRMPNVALELALPERAAWTVATLADDFAGKLSYERAVEPLSQLCQVQDMVVRSFARPALATIVAQESETMTGVAADHVQRGLESEWLVERTTAAWSATELVLHTPAAEQLRGPLRTALGDQSRFVRLNAAEAVFVSQFRGHAEPRFSRADAYALVEGASSVSEAPLRALAEAGLAAAAEQAETPTYLSTLTRTESLCFGHAVVDDIQVELQASANSSAPQDRAAAAAALGFVGPGFGGATTVRDRAVPVLNRLRTDENETVRRIVEWMYESGPNRWHSESTPKTPDDEQPAPRRLRVVDTPDHEICESIGGPTYLSI